MADKHVKIFAITNSPQMWTKKMKEKKALYMKLIALR